jgi:hypothetical protein
MDTRQHASPDSQSVPGSRPRTPILVKTALWSSLVLLAGSLTLCAALYQNGRTMCRDFQDSQRILEKMNQTVVELALQKMKYEKQLKISRPQAIASAYLP